MLYIVQQPDVVLIDFHNLFRVSPTVSIHDQVVHDNHKPAIWPLFILVSTILLIIQIALQSGKLGLGKQMVVGRGQGIANVRIIRVEQADVVRGRLDLGWLENYIFVMRVSPIICIFTITPSYPFAFA